MYVYTYVHMYVCMHRLKNACVWACMYVSTHLLLHVSLVYLAQFRMRRLYLNDTQKSLWLSGSAVMARIRSSLQEHKLLSCGGRLFTFWEVTVVPFEMKSRLHRKRGRGAAHMHNNELLKLPCSCVCMCKCVRTCVHVQVCMWCALTHAVSQ